MKKFLTFFALAGVVLFLSGCGTSKTTSTVTTTTTTATTDDSSRQNQDLWRYTGQEIIMNQTKDMNDFHIKLNKIIVGNTNFGKNEDGYTNIIATGYTYKWIIGDFTITSKLATANVWSLQFGIGRKNDGGGEMFNSASYHNQLSTGAQKFGFYFDNYSMPLAKGASTNIKVFIPMTSTLSGHIDYFFDIGDENHLDDDQWIMAEFPIGQSLNK